FTCSSELGPASSTLDVAFSSSSGCKLCKNALALLAGRFVSCGYSKPLLIVVRYPYDVPDRRLQSAGEPMISGLNSIFYMFSTLICVVTIDRIGRRWTLYWGSVVNESLGLWPVAWQQLYFINHTKPRTALLLLLSSLFST